MFSTVMQLSGLSLFTLILAILLSAVVIFQAVKTMIKSAAGEQQTEKSSKIQEKGGEKNGY